MTSLRPNNGGGAFSGSDQGNYGPKKRVVDPMSIDRPIQRPVVNPGPMTPAQTALYAVNPGHVRTQGIYNKPIN